jgi:hypothetical protein
MYPTITSLNNFKTPSPSENMLLKYWTTLLPTMILRPEEVLRSCPLFPPVPVVLKSLEFVPFSLPLSIYSLIIPYLPTQPPNLLLCLESHNLLYCHQNDFSEILIMWPAPCLKSSTGSMKSQPSPYHRLLFGRFCSATSLLHPNSPYSN